jgi:hypothetical protein
VRVRPLPGVTTNMLEDGQLELHSELANKRFRCDRVGAAVWIALRQHDGSCETAAATLADMWGTDQTDTQACVDLWVGALCDAGLMCRL